MAKEIERKFLLKNNKWKKEASKYIINDIKQGYLLSEKGKTVRIRYSKSDEEKGFITIKGPTKGISRDEYEYEIPAEDALKLLKMCPSILSKKRHHIPRGNNKYWEIDVFSGDNKGLVVAECELTSEKESILLPHWIGLEVTDDKRYANSNLIKTPFKLWK